MDRRHGEVSSQRRRWGRGGGDEGQKRGGGGQEAKQIKCRGVWKRRAPRCDGEVYASAEKPRDSVAAIKYRN